MEQGTRNLTVQEEKGASSSDLAFSVRENGDVFTHYGVSHTKEMHFVIIRDDLQHFSHLHPTRDSQGIWHIDFKSEAGGTHWLYADFVDSEGDSYYPRFQKTFAGDKGQYGLVKDFSTSKTVDGYHITMKPSLNGNSATFAYEVTDAKDNPVKFEDYLGAKGHSILLTPSGNIIHAHAEDVPPVFETNVMTGSFYRMFTQFQINGKVVTVPFDWQL